MATLMHAPRLFSAIARWLDRRSRFFGDMSRTTGADLDRLGHGCGAAALRRAVIRCQSCRVTEACEAWLAGARPGAAPPGFCPNAGLFREWRPRPEQPLAAGPSAGRTRRLPARALAALRDGYDSYRALLRLTDMSDDELADLGLRARTCRAPPERPPQP
ncbi:hypothetical protein DRV85_01425 [Rhodosalinus halophilus]|uniref:DUF6455 domain-containing protein n=1 Tax=Rhodosalinus halophilus TaxID=2259333 RepID=A0A365UF78_9RHOB|nr:DUF6455 family protein [Rhodosalinus halophilus]RBI87614.1 hypothetical protein DRV85_01425 [Rhodosalinus halophilus]